LTNRCAASFWPLRSTTQIPYSTFGRPRAGRVSTFTFFGTVRASVEYTKPASASPSATLASTSRTSVSRLTTFFSAALSFSLASTWSV
jgi:hypothetical protein